MSMLKHDVSKKFGIITFLGLEWVKEMGHNPIIHFNAYIGYFWKPRSNGSCKFWL